MYQYTQGYTVRPRSPKYLSALYLSLWANILSSFLGWMEAGDVREFPPFFLFSHLPQKASHLTPLLCLKGRRHSWLWSPAIDHSLASRVISEGHRDCIYFPCRTQVSGWGMSLRSKHRHSHFNPFSSLFPALQDVMITPTPDQGLCLPLQVSGL